MAKDTQEPQGRKADPLRLTGREYNIVRHVSETDGATIVTLLTAMVEDDGGMVNYVVGKLLKRKLLSGAGINLFVTEQGTAALAAWTPPQKGVKRDGTARRSSAIARFGERPEWMVFSVVMPEFTVNNADDAAVLNSIVGAVYNCTAFVCDHPYGKTWANHASKSLSKLRKYTGDSDLDVLAKNVFRKGEELLDKWNAWRSESNPKHEAIVIPQEEAE